MELAPSLEAVTHKENVRRSKGSWGRTDLRKVSENPDEAWCGKCRKFLPKENFSTLKKRWNGVASRCKRCYNTHRADRKGGISCVVE